MNDTKTNVPIPYYPGVYKITGTEGIYIGETSNLQKRAWTHKANLVMASRLYGFELNWDFEVLGTLPKGATKADRLLLEKHWQNYYATAMPDYIINDVKPGIKVGTQRKVHYER